MRYEDNYIDTDETQRIYTSWIDNEDDDDISSIDAMLKSYNVSSVEEFDEHNFFLEGIVKRLSELGEKIDIDDHKTIRRIIKERYKKRGLSLTDRERKRFDSWIKEKNVPDPAKGKDIIYELCIILDMTLEETINFIRKKLFTIPFNFKDKTDMVYYYGIKNSRGIPSIRKMLDTINQTNDVENYIETIEIQKSIDMIETDEEFIEYVENNCYSKEQMYISAHNFIISEFKDIRKKLQRDYNGYIEENKEEKEADNEYVIEQIFDINFSDYYVESSRKNIKNELEKYERIPKRFKTSLPKPQIISDVLNNKYHAYETLRKTVIILRFFNIFNMFSGGMKDGNKNDIYPDCEDFRVEINTELYEIGFAPIYIRDPFDWLIMHCAHSQYPIDKFQGLMRQAFNISDEI